MQSGPVEPNVAEPNLSNIQAESGDGTGVDWSWGFYNLEIARDGSYSRVVPLRNAEGAWGFHLNAVKLLEVSPGTDCIALDNIHLLSNGDLSVDISITNPFDNAVYTGFDVRGIIMFPASQYFPDQVLRELAGYSPWGTGMDDWKERYSSSEKGDAELMNPDGWTTIWAPDAYNGPNFQLEEGYPIFEYYQGKYGTGEELGTINAFKRYHSTEVRHMFEAGETVTRTYIIRPPADGPILASYAVYAHWAEPAVIPVTDPETDFPPEAGSPMPYEFYIYQTEILDPDKGFNGLGDEIVWHIETWDIGMEYWMGTDRDLMYMVCVGSALEPHPNGNPNEYKRDSFDCKGYEALPGALPGKCTYLFRLEVLDPNLPWWPIPLGTDWYIFDVEIDAPDGEW